MQVVSVPGLRDGVLQRASGARLRGARACDLDAYAAWCRELLARGVYPPPSQFEAWFPSLAHTPEQIDRTLDAAAAAFAALDGPLRGWRMTRERPGAAGAMLREQGGLMATLVAPDAGRTRSDSGAPIAPVAAPVTQGHPARTGPPRRLPRGHAQGRRQEYELLVETIYEGYLLHYGAPRVLAPPEADLGLLAGDRLYALGLARLVALGDTEAVAELADTITPRALAQAAGDHALAGAVWEAGARAVGWGSSAAHRRAKELAFAGSPDAFEAMRTSAVGVPASP